jgi:alpha/beta superfamily hydrolase
VGDDSDRDLHLPGDGRPGVAAVVLHPHPAMGGDRHHPLVVAVASGLADAGVAALRLDLADPDIPTSAKALSEEVEQLRADVGVERLVLIGYSWGSRVVAEVQPDGLAARVLIAPPVSHVDLPVRAEPALVLVPAHDQYGPPDAVEAALVSWPAATIEVVDGCDHFLVGAIDRITDRTVAWLTEG